MKTLYKFYLFNTVKHSSEKLTPILYAFTTDKKLYKKFKSFRDMDKFEIIKTDVTDDELIDFAHFNHKHELKEIVLKTRHPEFFNKISKVSIVGTRSEEEGVAFLVEDFFSQVKKAFKVNPILFNDEYKELLDNIGYTSLYKWVKSFSIDGFYSMRDFDEITDFSRNITSNFDFDEFNLFLAKYGGTMKIYKSEEE